VLVSEDDCAVRRQPIEVVDLLVAYTKKLVRIAMHDALTEARTKVALMTGSVAYTKKLVRIGMHRHRKRKQRKVERETRCKPRQISYSHRAILPGPKSQALRAYPRIRQFV
jgi:hypothetical protein